ncbi:glycoside hydrolase family 3 protein [Atractiella rhizophila]|nr:glycoside hydrolase family 3 protein [Atractiella rhizophila]
MDVADPFSSKSCSFRETWTNQRRNNAKDAFLNELVGKMTLPELVHQVHMTHPSHFAGLNADNSLYDEAMEGNLDAGLGVVHDWYPMNKTLYNDLQSINHNRSRLQIPFLQLGECLHGVGSFHQSMFPQQIALGASFDTDLAYAVGRAIGKEARSIGIHACLAPVLDLCKEPRWGRCQENFGEDFVLTSHIGVSYSSGLSKNGSWSDEDAVIPVMKHFAAHGSGRGGINSGSFLGRGTRQVIFEMLTPFKAVFDKGGVRGVMMYVPCHVNELLYDHLESWQKAKGDDIFVMADDTGVAQMYVRHQTTTSPADGIAQWFNASGGLQYYDYPLPVFLNATLGNVANGTVSESTIRKAVRKLLSAKYDLGLFDDPYIRKDIDPIAIADSHVNVTLDAARKAIVLLENKDDTLPIEPAKQGIKQIALVGPFADSFNYGDYSGPWGMTPTRNATTIRSAMQKYIEDNHLDVELVTSWGANNWMYNAQYVISPDLMSYNGKSGGLKATYYADMDFQEPVVSRIETPNLEWGMAYPAGLSSSNFSATWEGNLTVPNLSTNATIDGYIGAAVFPNCSARVFIDGQLVSESPATTSGNLWGNIIQLPVVQANGTMPPPGGADFTFESGRTYEIKVEFKALNLYRKFENLYSLNAQIELFWNLVDRQDPVGKAVSAAKEADLVVLAVGANWNSDGESGDRGTMGLSPNQTVLADAIFALGKPVVIVLQGGRPFAIPEYYAKAGAALDAFFPGQSGGQAISDVLFGVFNPGGKVPVSVPVTAAQLPVYYNYKYTDHARNYTDIYSFPQYSFGYGLSFTTFSRSNFRASASSFSSGDTIKFTVSMTNTGSRAGSEVPQVYLLQRRSQVTQVLKQLVAFKRVYLDAGETKEVTMELEVDRYLPIINRKYERELERGPYTFALLKDSTPNADPSMNVTLTSLG